MKRELLEVQMKKCASLIKNMSRWMSDTDIPLEKVIEENDDLILILTLQNRLIKEELTIEEYTKECQMIGLKGAKRNLQSMIESNAPKEAIDMIKTMIALAEKQVMEGQDVRRS